MRLFAQTRIAKLPLLKQPHSQQPAPRTLAAEDIRCHAAVFCRSDQMAQPLKFLHTDAAKRQADQYDSDFPSLSGGPQPASNAGQSSWNSNILRQPPTQQPQQPIQQRQSQVPQQPQQQTQSQQRVPSATLSQQSTEQPEEPRAQQPSADQSSGGGEEFPPLGVHTNGDGFEQANGLGGVTLRSPEGSQTQGNGQQTQLPFREASNAPAQTQQAPIGHPLTQTTSQQVSRFEPGLANLTATDIISSNNLKPYSQRPLSPLLQAAA